MSADRKGRFSIERLVMVARVKKRNGLLRDSRAVTSLEYGLIAAVLILTMLVGFNTLGRKTQTHFNNVAGKLNAT